MGKSLQYHLGCDGAAICRAGATRIIHATNVITVFPLSLTPSPKLLAYVVCFVGLEAFSSIHPLNTPGITPWYPPAGLTLALLLTCGVRTLPIVPIAVVLAEICVRGIPELWLPVVLKAMVLTAAYGGAALVLRHRLAIDPHLGRFSDFLRFIAVTVLATLMVAVTGAFTFLDGPSEGALRLITSIILPTWVSHFIGVLTLAPALLIYSSGIDRASRHRLTRGSAAGIVEVVAQVTCILLTVRFVFGFEGADEFKFFYPLFLPTIWVAWRHGLEGAAAGILLTEIALILTVQGEGQPAATVNEFQMLMSTLSLTGLFLGAVVSQTGDVNRALQESKARLTAILNTAPDAVLTVDIDGRIESGNAAVGGMFGYAGDVVQRLPVNALLPNIDLHERGGGHEMMGVRADGSQFPADVAVGETAVGDRPIYIAIARDVSRRARAEAWVRRHRSELAHADRVSMIGAMTSAIAHEVSQPLAAIATYTRACRLQLDAPKVDMAKLSATLDKLAIQEARAREVLVRLREFLRRGDMHAVPCVVSDITGVVEALSRADVAAHGIRLEIALPPDLPDVMADRVHIEQVLLNLVRNAVDANSEMDGAAAALTEPLIRISARCAPDERVEFTVTDSGPGISPAIVGQLFQAFTTTKGQGMGLGLSICRTIVEAHGGRLRYEPGQGPGATFVFDLPEAESVHV
jgi:PAS domain S-box-containing protein